MRLVLRIGQRDDGEITCLGKACFREKCKLNQQ